MQPVYLLALMQAGNEELYNYICKQWIACFENIHFLFFHSFSLCMVFSLCVCAFYFFGDQIYQISATVFELMLFIFSFLFAFRCS